MNKKEEDVGKVDGGWMAGALGAPRKAKMTLRAAQPRE